MAPGDENFSVLAFLDDQWKSKSHLPLVYAKITEVNDVQQDSTVVFWSEEMVEELKEEFAPADIGAPADINQYQFTLLESHNDMTALYEAISDKQSVRKQMVSMAPETGFITSVYTEVNVDGIFSSENKKMTYFTEGTIKIVKYKSPIMGSPKNIVITYKII